MTKPGQYTPRALSYENQPDQIKNREARNAARRHDEAAGKQVKGKDVAHVKALANHGARTDANTKLDTITHNRGWRKGQKGYKVPNI